MVLCCTITFEEKGSFCEVVCLLAVWHILLFLLDNEQGHSSCQPTSVQSNLVFYAKSTIAVISGRTLFRDLRQSKSSINLEFYAQSAITIISGQLGQSRTCERRQNGRKHWGWGVFISL